MKTPPSLEEQDVERLIREIKEHVLAMDRSPRISHASIYNANFYSVRNKLDDLKAILKKQDAERESINQDLGEQGADRANTVPQSQATAETPESVEANTVPGPMERLVAACELTLLFYTVGPWTDEKRAQWSEKMDSILGPVDKRGRRAVGDNGDGTWDGARPSNEATTKNLCNAVRAALAQ